MSKEKLNKKNHTSHFALHTSNKGITLIALIITIVVMLILVAVTLDIAIGENGLVNKAKTAGEATTREIDREKLLTAVVGAIGNDGTVKKADIVLPEGFTEENGVYTSENGNSFTVSINGNIDYEGITGSEDEVETVDLNGKYILDNSGFFIEFRNYDTWVAGDEDGEYSYPMEMTIDETTKSGTINVYYYFDEDTMELGEPYAHTYTYYLIMEDNKVVNKLIYLVDESDEADVLYQNTNGFEHNLNGIYLSENGERRLTFDSSNGTVDSEYKSGDIWYYVSSGENMVYFEYNGICSLDGEGATVAKDLTTIDYNGYTYTKQVTE